MCRNIIDRYNHRYRNMGRGKKVFSEAMKENAEGGAY